MENYHVRYATQELAVGDVAYIEDGSLDDVYKPRKATVTRRTKTMVTMGTAGGREAKFRWNNQRSMWLDAGEFASESVYRRDCLLTEAAGFAAVDRINRDHKISTLKGQAQAAVKEINGRFLTAEALATAIAELQTIHAELEMMGA